MITIDEAIRRASDRTDLDRLHREVIDYRSHPDLEDIAKLWLGELWFEMLTLEEAIEYCRIWLNENHLDIGQSCSHLLSLNRRRPWSEYAIKTGIPKTNWHRYGRCPYVKNEKHTYSKLVLHRWLDENIRPTARSVEKAS